MVVAKSNEAFRTISEVADELEIPKHVLRFWEGKFSQLKPMKRGGGRRYYRPEDIELLKGIQHLLKGDGYTIRGVQKLIKNQGVGFVKNCWRTDDNIEVEPAHPNIPDLASEAAESAARSRNERAARDVRKDAGTRDLPEIVLTPQKVQLLRTAIKDLKECEELLGGAH